VRPRKHAPGPQATLQFRLWTPPLEVRDSFSAGRPFRKEIVSRERGAEGRLEWGSWPRRMRESFGIGEGRVLEAGESLLFSRSDTHDSGPVQRV
jgi:hypothetical protein